MSPATILPRTTPRFATTLTLITAAIAFAVPANLQAQASAKQVSIPPPPMGWSSWNSFSNTINSQITQDQAKAMISTGMAKAGYRYINIDEGWWLGQRDADGNIVVDPKAWPAIAPGEQAGDMANIVRYIHSLGLKAGIYTDAGRDGCSTTGPDLGPSFPNTGSEGHYEQDFLQFAKWGFDYVKVDWCGGYKENLDPAIQYAEIARAIALAEAATGHTLYYSICDWGKQSPWTWAPGVGGVSADIWRTSGDIVAPVVANSKNSNRKAGFGGMLSNFDQGVHPEAQHTGYYNDPDMMVIGMPGLSDAQNRVHMALWAMSGAPLIVGADLTTLSEATRATLMNPAVLSIDQDALGLQAAKVAEPSLGLEVWSKPLSTPGQRAVLLLNRSNAAAAIPVNFTELRLSDSANVAEAWSGKIFSDLHGSYSTPVPAQDAILLIVTGAEVKPVRYEPEPTGHTLAEKAAIRFTGITSKFKVTRIDIAYTNSSSQTAIVELRTNSQTSTRIAFPPTGDAAQGTISIQTLLDPGAAKNTLNFSFSTDANPSIQSITVY